MRVDTATEILGIRVNIWLSIIGIGGALIAVVARGLWRRPDDSDEPYTDGHRWSDPRSEAGDPDTADGDVDAQADTAGDTDTDTDGETADGADEDPSATDDDAVVSEDPAEGPRPA